MLVIRIDKTLSRKINENIVTSSDLIKTNIKLITEFLANINERKYLYE